MYEAYGEHDTTQALLEPSRKGAIAHKATNQSSDAGLKEIIVQTMEDQGGDLEAAAELLGVTPSVLRDMMRKHGIGGV